MNHSEQSKWVIEEVFPGLRGGFFVELGAGDGIENSDTYTLEKYFGWDGICIEANKNLFKYLSRNRQSVCANVCVDKKVNEVSFIDNGYASGIIADDTDNSKNYNKAAFNIAAFKKHGKVKKIRTKMFCNVLVQCKSPAIIHYLSLDVEGAETRILCNFCFDRFMFLSMTIEQPTKKLNQILHDNDYVFVKNMPISGKREDSFYIHKSIDNGSIKKEEFSQVRRRKPYIAKVNLLKYLKKRD